MELRDATTKAKQILDEERVHPTVRYGHAPGLNSIQLLTLITLSRARFQYPREIDEEPGIFRFESTNYELLCALLSQLSETDRPQYKHYVGLRLGWGVGCARSQLNVHPKWDSLISELPLAVEFLIRNGQKADLLEALDKKDLHVFPGHMLLLMQLEDMIATNYFLLTEPEYESLSTAVKQFAARVTALSKECEKNNVREIRYPDIGTMNARWMYREMLTISGRIIELCRKAQYLYLKGSLLQGFNLEINQDKVAVENFLNQLGFSRVLVESLNEADRLYSQPGTEFDLKSSVGHLRSFLEELQFQAIQAVHAKCGGNLPTSWGGGLAYLLTQNVLSKTEEQFIAHFYTLISDEGVHPLIAEREYARLARNMVIEYALLFLRKMDKLGLHLP
jgi:hypothetical protein